MSKKSFTLRSVIAIATISALLFAVFSPSVMEVKWKGDIRFAGQLEPGSAVRIFNNERWMNGEFVSRKANSDLVLIKMPRWKTFRFSSDKSYQIISPHHAYTTIDLEE